MSSGSPTSGRPPSGSGAAGLKRSVSSGSFESLSLCERLNEVAPVVADGLAGLPGARRLKAPPRAVARVAVPPEFPVGRDGVDDPSARGEDLPHSFPAAPHLLAAFPRGR